MAPAHEHEVGVAGEHLLREGRELGDVLGHEHRVDLGPLGAEDGGDGRFVALPEGGVLREDGDLHAVEVVEEGSRRRDVLRALPARTERVVVDARDRVRGSRPGDVEDLVLLGLLCHGEGDTGGDGSGEDVHARPDELLHRGDGLVGVAAVVAVLHVDGRAVDFHRAVGGPVEAGLETVEVLFAVAGESTGFAGDDADGDLARGAVVTRGVAALGSGLRCAGPQDEGARGDRGPQEELLRTPHVRAFRH